MSPLATSYSTTPFSLPPQTTTTSLTYHLLCSIFSLSDGVLRRPVELAPPRKRTSESRAVVSAKGPTADIELVVGFAATISATSSKYRASRMSSCFTSDGLMTPMRRQVLLG